MKKNQKVVTINSMVKGQLLKNITPLFFIGLICFLSSYVYNFKIKTITYDYMIQVEPVKIWITENSLIVEEDLAPQNFIEFFIQDYISKLPQSTVDKKFRNNILSFKSYDKPIDVSKFTQILNEKARRSVYLNLNNKYNILSRALKTEENIDFNEYVDSLKEYPDFYRLQKLEKIMQDRIELDQSKMSISANLNELSYLINNFNELFSTDMYYSLNGWEIKDNKYNTAEVFVAGLLFWFLLSSFFLFFRSDYFKKKLSN